MDFRIFPTAALVSLLGAPALAVVQPAHLMGGPEAAVAERVMTWEVPTVTKPAWAHFIAANGPRWRAYFDAATGVPSRIWGAGVEAPGTVDSAALASRESHDFLARHLDLLAPGARIGDFVEVGNHLARGMRTVGLLQYRDGVRVIGGQVSFRFKNDRLFVIGSEALPYVPAAASGAIIERSEALRIAELWIADDFGSKATGTRVSAPQVLPQRGAGVDYRTVLEAIVEGRAPTGVWSVYLDALTGETIAREQRLMFASGTLSFNAPDRYPAGARSDYPVPELGVDVEMQTVNTSPAGVIIWNGTTAANVSAGVVGPKVEVINRSGTDATVSFLLDPDGTYVWDERGDEILDAQLTAFIGASRAKQFAKALDPDLTWLDTNALRTHVNHDDEACNAYSDGTSIHFFVRAQGCENTARLVDVVAHEFGHAFHFHEIIPGVGDFDSALSEGGADYFTAALMDDPGMGRGFFGTDEPLRHLDPAGREYTWPEDEGFDPHDTGLIIGGALWDLRKGLVDALGKTDGEAQANALFVDVFRRAVDIPSSYVEVLAGDDDDGNLDNGTPNRCAIDDAFGLHGLADPQSGAAIARPTLEHLTVTLPSTGQPACPGAAVTTATLSWRLEDGSNLDTPMTPGDVGYTAELPSALGQTVDYQVRVTLENGRTLTYPDNPADPYYDTFVGDTVPVFCTDFEMDPYQEGWEHSLVSGEPTEGADDWQHGMPAGMAGSGDPGEAFSGENVVGNDLGGGNYNGLYQSDKVNRLVSPKIPRQGFSNLRLQYRRWLNVEDGRYDRAVIYANDVEVWRNADLGGDTHHQDREWRFHDVDLTAAVANDDTVTIAFEIQSDRGLEFGGWTLDDFCIVSFVPGSAPCAGDDCVSPDRNDADLAGTTRGKGGGCSASSANGLAVLAMAALLLWLPRRKRIPGGKNRRA